MGVGYSLHAGQVVVADGTQISQERIFRVLTWDPMSAILRHAAAGYSESIQLAIENNITLPGQKDQKEIDYKKLYQELFQMVKERTGIELFPQMEKIELNLL